MKSIGYGGAPAAPELVRRIEAMFPGRTPSNGYGLTETSSVTTMNSGADYVHKPDSVGVPVAVCDVKVVDDDGTALPTGSVGELWIKGPNVVKGYFNKPEATDASFTDGWLHSGDVARLDDEGFVFIVDRAKDMVIRGGENVYCVEVEAALFEHPAVSDAAVIGIPHQVLGEEVGAVVHARARQVGDRGGAEGARRRAARGVQGARADLVPRRASAPQPGGEDPQARPAHRTRRRWVGRRGVSVADRVDAVHAEFRRRSALSLGGEVSADDGLLLWAGPTPRPSSSMGSSATTRGVSPGATLAGAAELLRAPDCVVTPCSVAPTPTPISGRCVATASHPELAAGGLPEMVLHDRAAGA